MNMRAEAIEKQKPKRVPMGRRNVLAVKGITDDENFHYHWFNDIDERLHNCLEAGYQFVARNGLEAGDKTVESARGTDSIMKKGVGGGRVAYLMRIPIELYKEDQRMKQLQVDELEATLKAPKVEGSYGKVEVTRK